MSKKCRVSFDCHLVSFVPLLVPLQIKHEVKERKHFPWMVYFTSIKTTDVPEAIFQARPTNEKIPFFP